ncbi:amidohydrolase [Mycolicibacterium sp. 050158]|uniref:amidohydrolase n=1 Tax=Mycolicibacterium sp. 050158 TaxID=3090602 RepID=UPI00299CD97B|nr:amidohydrolase [Mycolicibacterium sp. 050158]MDX1891231.1 amidohydrolase [Mycolicibacterium sp. 050158]
MITDTTPAERIFRGGTILTMDDARPRVQAIAIGSGRILAVGDDADVMVSRGEGTEVIDLHGHTLMPSFVDAHGHFANAPQIVKWANVSGEPAGPVTCIADIGRVLTKFVAANAVAPGEWVVGYGYDASNLTDGRQCTRDDLDSALPDNPVMLIHSSNHGAVLNSPAFAAVGYDATTETPPGGLILRKPGSNEPEGLIMETAFAPIFANMPQPSADDLLAAFDAAQQLYASKGTTTVQEGATHANDLALLRTAADQGRLYLDVVAVPLVLEVPKFIEQYFPDFTGGPTELPDNASDAFGTYRDRLKLQGIKCIVDGSPQGKTAYWTQPLLTPGPNGEADWCGQPVFPKEVIDEMIKEIADADIQIFSHCNGDAAIDLMIDACRAAGMTAGDDRRTVIIHSQFMRPEQLDEYVELGLSPSFFTVHAYFWGDLHVQNLGRPRAYFLSPMASAIDKGLHYSNHNDFSVTPIDPMRMTWSAVTRQSRSGEVIGPDERVTPWQALKALTIEAAWQIREEDAKGTLAPGKLADLVVLDADPTSVPVDEILDIAVVETFKEGRSVYRA